MAAARRFILTGMRVAKEDRASIFSGVQIMQESTAFDMAIEEGLEKGRLEEAGESFFAGRGTIQHPAQAKIPNDDQSHPKPG